MQASLFDANCYLLWDSELKVALVVDPGPGTSDAALEIVTQNQLTLGAILLTHGHVDHVWEAARLSDEAGQVPVYYTEPDGFFLEDPAGLLGFDPALLGLDSWEIPSTLHVIEDLDLGPVPGINLRVVPSPGHSPGSALFLVGATGLEAPLALSGDVVFAGSVGRTDLPGGDEYEMRQSLRTLSNALDPMTVLLPGHGPETTWRNELASNPYVQRACKIG